MIRFKFAGLYQPKRREHETYFLCDSFAGRGDIPCGRTTTWRPTEGRGIGAISLCAMSCRAEWPVALSHSNGAEFFKSCKVAGYDGYGASSVATIISPGYAQYHFRRRPEKQRHYLHPQPEGRQIDDVNCIVLCAVRQPQAHSTNENDLYRPAKADGPRRGHNRF